MEEIFCVLGDCYKEECHHCFPVINCSFGHSWCKKNGCVDEINIKKKVLVTGCAGFIGFHTTKYLLENGYHIQGIDNMNEYYDVSIKKEHIKILCGFPKFKFIQNGKIKNELTFKIFQLITIILINAMSILGVSLPKKM